MYYEDRLVLPCRLQYFALKGEKLYYSITAFNRLLIDQGLEVNEKNIVTLANVFVLIANAEYKTFPKLSS